FGQVQFGPFDTILVILALVAALISAFNLWRIGEREDREAHLLQALHNTRYRAKPGRIPRTPWYQQLGARIAATKIIGAAKQENLLSALVAAGIKGHGHLAALIAGKLCAGAAFVPLCWLLIEWGQLF